MFKILLKKQLSELFSGFLIERKSGKVKNTKSIIIYSVLYVLLFGFLGVAFYVMSRPIAKSIIGIGIDWLYFALAGIVSIALGIFGSVFNTYAGVYLPKDNELLLSLPIPERSIILARAAEVYSLSLFYSALTWIPAIIAYYVTADFSFCSFLFPILLTFIIPLFISVLSFILGWFVALIASKTKGKSFIIVILSLAFLALYYIVYFKMIESLEDIVNHLDTIGDTIKSWFHFIYLLGVSADGDILRMLIFTVINFAISLISLCILVKTFTKLTLSLKGGESGSKKKVRYDSSSYKKSLLKREFNHFTSLPSWMLNGALGLLFMIVIAVGAIIKADTIRNAVDVITQESANVSKALPVILISLIAFMISSDSLLSSSISLEGKTLWIIQSLPIDTWEIIKTKEIMGFLLNVFPALILAITFGIIVKINIVFLILIIISTILFILLFDDFGLFLNIRHPNLTWTNPVVIIKQGMPVVITLFGSWGFCSLCGFGGFFLSKITNAYFTMVIIILLFVILYFILHRWLKTKGTQILRTL